MVCGLNILGDRGASEDALLTYVKQLKPRFCVCLNNTGLATKLAAYTSVIVRFTPDDDAQDRGSGAAFVAARAANVPKGCYLYCGNEPGRASAFRLNQFTMEAQDEALKRGLKLCILNWSTGVPEADDWDTVAPCIERAVRRGDLIGVHTYFMGKPLNPPSFPYHVGRWEAAQKRFGGQWVITELGYDLNFQGNGWQAHISATEYIDDLKTLAIYHALHQTPFCIFSWPEWDGHGFGVDQARVLQEYLTMFNATYQLEEQPTMPDVPGFVAPPTSARTPVRITALPPGVAFRNIRAQPNGSAADVGDLNVGDDVVASLSAPANGWVYLERPADGVQGWALWGGVSYSTAPVQTPTPAPVSKPDVDGALNELNLAIIAQREADTRVQNAQARLRGALLPSGTGGGF